MLWYPQVVEPLPCQLGRQVSETLCLPQLAVSGK